MGTVKTIFVYKQVAVHFHVSESECIFRGLELGTMSNYACNINTY